MPPVESLLAGLIVGATVVALVGAFWAPSFVQRRRHAASPSPVNGDGSAGGEWVWTVSTAGIFTSSTPSSLTMIGYRPADLIGQNITLVMDPRELARAEAMVNGLGIPHEGLGNLIISGRRNDGTSSWYEVSVEAELDASGATVGFRGTSRLIGPQHAQLIADQTAKVRIQNVITGRLLITAFQPILDLRAGKVVGVEGLTRFVEDAGTSPDIWFAEATAVGLGPQLELLAIDTALRTAADVPGNLYVSVNVSPQTCLDPRLAELILGSAVDPQRIVLELTEHSPVTDYDALNLALVALRAAGVRVAIDDAGAGFASGQHMVKLKPDIIKLDRGIITGIDRNAGQRALAAGLVAFAAHTGAQVTAEGIENRSELISVTALGIQSGQGYLFSRPTVRSRDWMKWQAKGGRLHGVGAGDDRIGVPLPCPNLRTADGHDAAFALTVLDALPDATAVLDADGVIVAVNLVWRMFAADNGGRPECTGVGVNYLDVCARAADTNGQDAAKVLQGLKAVLAGDVVDSEWEYACPSPAADRWFLSRVSAIGAPPGGAVVSHVNITRLKRSEQELAHRASHDPLTGLANRMLFDEMLEKSLSRRPSRQQAADVGVLYIDLDGFKPVNDAFGHAAGDEVLLVATHRLRSLVRPQDTVARLGGDEFAICAPRIDETTLEAMAARLDAALAEPYLVHGRSLVITASIGSVLATQGDDAGHALDTADRAMYAAKERRTRSQLTIAAS